MLRLGTCGRPPGGKLRQQTHTCARDRLAAVLIRSVVELEATPDLDHQLLRARELKDVVAWLRGSVVALVCASRIF
jgi:hypothetical protein